MMKRLSLTILFCVLLSGCMFDPVFDTSSWDAYQQSIDAINAKLSNDDSRRLDVALKYLLFESMPTIAVNGPLLSRVGTSPNVADPYLILARLGPKINGRSAAEVVSNLSLKLDGEIAAMEARKPGDVLGLSSFFAQLLLAAKRLSGATGHRVLDSQRWQDPDFARLLQNGSDHTGPVHSLGQSDLRSGVQGWSGSRARSGISACNSSPATGAIRNCSISPMLNSR
jgi:hypothetical protein